MLEEIGGSNRQGKGRRGADFLENTKCHSEDCSNHKTRSFASGDVYVGEWAEGKMHGQGKTTWADGDVYVGEYAVVYGSPCAQPTRASWPLNCSKVRDT